MKLSELRERMQTLCAPIGDETLDDYSQRVWEGLPRIPYKELPASLQKIVRSRFTAQDMREFLTRCYAPLAKITEAAAPEATPPEGMSMEEYLSFGHMTSGIPSVKLDDLLIRTRNTAVYTIEGDDLTPMLYGNHACEAFEAVISEYRERLEDRKPGKTPRPQNAERLVSAGSHQYIISDKKYQHALTTKPNGAAYIALMTPDFFDRMTFSDDGMIFYDDEKAGIIRQYTKDGYSDIQNLDTALLTQIYTAAVRAHIKYDAFTITVSLPKFLHEMKIDASKTNANDIMTKLHSFEQCVGIMPESQIVSKLFSIIQINAKNQTMTFAVPYIMKLYELLEDKNHVKKETRKGDPVDYLLPFHNTLIHSDIVKERNKAAVELVYWITTGLMQRAFVPDVKTYRKKTAVIENPNQITYSVSFRTLIEKTQILLGRLMSYRENKEKNKALIRAFEKAYQLLETKTDMRSYFINPQFRKVIPSMSSLDDELVIIHEGKNGKYNQQK